MNLFYGIQATGRGHISRFIVARDILAEAGHTVFGFASGSDLPGYADGINRFESGPTFIIRHNRIDIARTALHNTTHLPRYLAIIRDLKEHLCSGEFDQAVIDFEPLSARAARSSRIPTVLFDNQTAALLDGPLPACLRVARTQLRAFVRAYYQGLRWPQRIVTYSLVPAEPRYDTQLITPPCVRREVEQLSVSVGTHLLYYRSIGPLPPGLVEFARRHPDVEVRVYAPHATPVPGMPDNIVLRAHDNRRFLDDFASCRVYITGAGFESVAEAVYLRKPLFVVPIAGQWEQQINAHLIAEHGIGKVAHNLAAASFEAALAHAAPPAPTVRDWVATGRQALRKALLAPL